jgi:hypothetical protein
MAAGPNGGPLAPMSHDGGTDDLAGLTFSLLAGVRLATVYAIGTRQRFDAQNWKPRKESVENESLKEQEPKMRKLIWFTFSYNL